MPRFQSAVLIRNPGKDNTPTIGTVVASYPETLVRTCEARDAAGHRVWPVEDVEHTEIPSSIFDIPRPRSL
jgi:hypothetical protein